MSFYSLDADRDQQTVCEGYQQAIFLKLPLASNEFKGTRFAICLLLKHLPVNKEQCDQSLHCLSK